MMKKCLAILFTGALLMTALAACGGNTSSTSAAASSAPSASVAAPSAAPSAAASDAGGQYDVNELLATLSEAANLGTTIAMSELDLKAGGVDVSIVSEWAGATSQRASENGGQVIVLRATPGQADALAQQMEALRDSHINENYKENENANANTKEARIVTNGDYVVYAVSATGTEGGWPALDDAIAAAFA